MFKWNSQIKAVIGKISTFQENARISHDYWKKRQTKQKQKIKPKTKTSKQTNKQKTNKKAKKKKTV